MDIVKRFYKWDLNHKAWVIMMFNMRMYAEMEKQGYILRTEQFHKIQTLAGCHTPCNEEIEHALNQSLFYIDYAVKEKRWTK